MQTGIRHFVMGIITKATAEGPGMRKDRPFVNKLNLILVQVLCPVLPGVSFTDEL